MIIRFLPHSRTQQMLLFAFGISVIIYAMIVLVYVSSSYEIGIYSILAREVVGEPRNVKPERGPLVQAGDRITRVGGLPPIQTGWDLLEAPRTLQQAIAAGEVSES